MRKVYLDIETTMDHKEITLIGWRVGGKNKTSSSLTNFRIDCLDILREGDVVYTFNGEGFDFPILSKHMHTNIPLMLEEKGVKLVDLYLVSKMIAPDRASHSLDSWAKDIDPTFTKLEVDYDNAPVEELDKYLRRDLEITERVEGAIGSLCLKYVSLEGALAKPLRVEQQVRRIITRQKEVGFPFDVARATSLVDTLQVCIDDCEHEASEWLPEVKLPESKLDYPPKVQLKKDGTVSVAMEKWCGRNKVSLSMSGKPKAIKSSGVVIGPLPLTEPVETTKKLTLKDQIELKKWLMAMGWEPTMWNTNSKGEKSGPMLSDRVTKEVCPNLKSVLDSEQIDVIQDFLVARSRKNILLSDKGTGLLTKVSRAGRIHADADTLGTPTGRFRHRTIVNIPRVGSAWGENMRELFTASTNKVMVGWDASSLEACMEAHYVMPFDKDYANELMEGDVHTRNQEALGLPTRAVAKTFKYAVTYGAKPPTLASSLNVPLVTAEMWYNEFWEANTGLTQLISYLKSEWLGLEKKYIRGLDGRLITTRSEHSLLNSKLQSAGAIVMKYAMLIADAKAGTFSGLGTALIRYHDEEQWECDPKDADELGQIGVDSIRQAGEVLGLRVPLTGEYKVGNNWSQTH